MKKIQLLNLKLVNFKGIKEFELAANGQDINVFGSNGTGKTTLFDAFVWLLFGKDSNNSTKFEIKTLNNGQPIHKLEHEVEGTLLVEGNELKLKKVYKENWTKKSGSITESFSGHTTKYFIDDVPSKKKEYDETIKNLVVEDIFKLLTNPSYFNEQLHWEKRRNVLLEIAGDVTDEDVISSNKELEKLSDVLSNRTIEDHKKVIAAKRKEINEELERIPVRIDEINRGLPNTEGLDKKSITAKLDSLLDAIDTKNEQINSIKNGSEVNSLKQKISEIELRISNVRNEHTQNEQEELFKLKTRLQEEQSNLNILRSDLKNYETQKQQIEKQIKDLETQMQSLRDEYIKESKNEFDHESNCTCPTCEQELPEEQMKAALERFNVNKSNTLENINKRGVELKNNVQEYTEEIERIQKQIEKTTELGKQKKSGNERLEEKIQKSESTVKPIEDNPDFIKLNEEKQALEQQIKQLELSVDESVEKVKEEIKSLKEEQNSLQLDLSAIQQSEQSLERIKELEAREKKLAEEFEQLEHDLYLIEEFTRSKVNMLEDKINNKFKHARFKLFETQINGGLKETCETLYDGVPYSSGLNNAAQINVGLDIINTLSSHYDVQAPIFVDNAESVTKLIDIDSQVISLVVSESDKQLRTEPTVVDHDFVVADSEVV